MASGMSLTCLVSGLLCTMASITAWSSDEWPAVGGDAANTRFSTLDQINVSNVGTLKGAWETELAAPSRTPPVIAGGLLYINDASTIYAIDARSGQVIWHFRPAGASPARGGIAFGAGLLFCGLSDAHIVALDPRSGKLVWTGFIGNEVDPEDRSLLIQWPGPIPAFNAKVGTIVSAPLYVNGTVISGLSGGDGGSRGVVAALDAHTGKPLWRFFVIPTPGGTGSQTWPKEGGALSRGGGAVWSQGAADAQLGLVYFGTGNPVPPLGGETRPGDNLYTASVVALDIRTGKVRWHFQLTHHDVWEMDVATPIILYTSHVNGKPRKSLAVARTDGYLFFLDRITGKPVFPISELPVKQDVRLKTVPTQPFPIGADRIGPTCVDPATAASGFILGCWFDPIYADRQNVLMPQMNMRQAPMSFDPNTGYFYVMAQATPIWLGRSEDPYSLIMGRPTGAKEYGLYGAIDSRTDKLVWQKRSPWGLSGGSGALTTAGGLLFHMEPDGNILADNAKTGELLWKFQTGSVPLPGVVAFAGGVPAATYKIDGAQYLAVVTNKSLWTFTLSGNLAERAPPPLPTRVVGFSGPVRQMPGDGSGKIVLGIGQGFKQEGGAEAELAKKEYGFSPERARVKPGVTLSFTNGGRSAHTIVAEDGSWTTGPIAPGQSAAISFPKAETYTFWSEDSPWDKGQLIVENTEGPPFTEQQAADGEKVFAAYCSSCHGADLTGANGAPELAGEAFLQRWQHKSLEELFTRISTTMPKERPHSLTDRNYLEVVAFIIKSNGFPPGNTDLPANPQALEKLPVVN